MTLDLSTLSCPVSVSQQLRGPRRGQPALVATSPAEATPTAGLVITPELSPTFSGGWSFTGEWTVLHQPSGRAALPSLLGANLGHARDAAVLLGELEVDWTQPTEALLLHAPAMRAALGELRQRLHVAIEEARPARLQHSSWRQMPPPYWISTEHGEADEVFTSFTDAADCLAALGWDDAVIGRADTPWWSLHCAATDCRRPLLEDDGWGPHRSELAALAGEEGGRRLDAQRWLCAPCSALFTPTRPY